MGLTATLLESVRVLVVEDDEDDFVVTRDMLDGQERLRFAVDWCSDYDSALAAIREERHDVYLIDYALGPCTGLELVRAGFASRPTAPVIALTGRGDFAIDSEATDLGFTDFLVKQDLDPVLLERSIRYALSHHRALSALALSEERYALAVRAASGGIWDWDLARDRIYLSPRWHAIMGQPQREDEQPSAAWLDLVHPDDVWALRGAIDVHLRGASPHLESELRMRHRDGRWRWVLIRALAVRDRAGTATRLAGSVLDITQRRAAENQLRDGAFHDSLTGLPNRALFMDRAEQALRRAVRDPTLGCAVLFIDIDNFKQVNDTLTHAAGDRLLIALSTRVAGAIRPGDTAARLGGDEFTVLLDGVVDQAEAVTVAERLQQEIETTFRIEERELLVTACIGVAFSVPGIDGGQLLRNADIAMYDAKRNGRSQLSIFNEAMHRRIVKRVALESDLRKALEGSLLSVHYQPIVDLDTGKICALEALARWPEQWPSVAPVDFIPVAEQTGLINPLGLHVLRLALDALAGWRRQGLLDEDVRMSVNVSGRQLEDHSLPGLVCELLHRAELPASALVLEITESTLMQDPDQMQIMVSELCDTGVGLYLDDYGTGYSSLSALHRYPVDAIKIDRSFVAAMNTDHGDVIVRSTVALGHSLGLTAVAEGIEDVSQLQRLRDIGCKYGQGYLLARPQSRAGTETLLADWTPRWVAACAQHAVPRV